MAHHGAVTVGNSLAVAFDHAYYLEQAAMVQVEWEKYPTVKQSLIEETVALSTCSQLENNKSAFAQVHLNSFINKCRFYS
jgi:ribulose-5-phosphate 4-epimerase/fuculose-1-phosphate aldolase